MRVSPQSGGAGLSGIGVRIIGVQDCVAALVHGAAPRCRIAAASRGWSGPLAAAVAPFVKSPPMQPRCPWKCSLKAA